MPRHDVSDKRARARFAGRRILVVDDSELNCEAVRYLLEGQGGSVQLAASGQEALDLLARTPDGFDIVLMDIEMPAMNGYEATRRLREIPGLFDLPVVALSADSFPDQEEKVFSAGMNAYITKPLNVDELVATLRCLDDRPAITAKLLEGVSKTTVSLPVDGDRPVLDVQRALANFGDAAVYQRLLRRFAGSYGRTGQDLTALLARVEPVAAAALAHKLKGAAGALELPDVARCAGLLEQRLKEGLAPEDCGEQLQVALDAALAAIRDLLSLPERTNRTGPAKVDLAAVAPSLRELLRALDRDNPDQAEPVLAALARLMPSAELQTLNHHVDAFDFRAAEAEVRLVAQRLGVDISGTE